MQRRAAAEEEAKQPAGGGAAEKVVPAPAPPAVKPAAAAPAASAKDKALAEGFMAVCHALASVAKLLDPEAEGVAATAAPVPKVKVGRKRKEPPLGKDGLPKAKREPTLYNKFMADNIPKFKLEARHRFARCLCTPCCRLIRRRSAGFPIRSIRRWATRRSSRWSLTL